MTERAYMPDYLRLFALFGIVVVNVQGMAYPLVDGFSGAMRPTPGDTIVVWLVDGLAFLKTYGLFSFMFGVGFAFQIRSAEQRSLPFGQLYRNRMIGLFLLGCLHGCLLFPFDILVLYSITGAILYPMRDWSVRSLVRVGIVLLMFQIILASALFPTQQPMEDVARIEREIMSGGDFIGVTVFRTITFATILPFLLILQGFSALGWFCLGLAAVKSGLIDTPDHRLWVTARRWCLGPGVALSLLATGIRQWGATDIGMVMTVACAPITTIGYLGLIAAVARPPGPVMARVLTVGGSSLSVYLGQSIILATVFAPYGFDLWNGVSPATAVALALLVTVALILALTAWRLWFPLGPFESALRRITRYRVNARPHPAK